MFNLHKLIPGVGWISEAPSDIINTSTKRKLKDRTMLEVVIFQNVWSRRLYHDTGRQINYSILLEVDLLSVMSEGALLFLNSEGVVPPFPTYDCDLRVFIVQTGEFRGHLAI
jgi:hypothetical protein